MKITPEKHKYSHRHNQCQSSSKSSLEHSNLVRRSYNKIQTRLDNFVVKQLCFSFRWGYLIFRSQTFLGNTDSCIVLLFYNLLYIPVAHSSAPGPHPIKRWQRDSLKQTLALLLGNKMDSLSFLCRLEVGNNETCDLVSVLPQLFGQVALPLLASISSPYKINRLNLSLSFLLGSASIIHS